MAAELASANQPSGATRHVRGTICGDEIRRRLCWCPAAPGGVVASIVQARDAYSAAPDRHGAFDAFARTPARQRANNACYYAQRASAALIISEATQVPMQGQGYLIDQFISSSTNHRTDVYGGSVANQARLLMEIVEAVTIWGPDRVGVRLSPLGALNDISDAEPETTFGATAQVLSDFRFAYLQIVNPAVAATEKGEAPDARAERMLAIIRKKYRGTLILCGGFDRDTAEAWLEQSKADLIAFGRQFLANPDLLERFRGASRSMPTIRPLIMAAPPKAIPTIRRSRRKAASNRKPASTIDGDSARACPAGFVRSTSPRRRACPARCALSGQYRNSASRRSDFWTIASGARRHGCRNAVWFCRQ